MKSVVKVCCTCSLGAARKWEKCDVKYSVEAWKVVDKPLECYKLTFVCALLSAHI